MMFGSDVYCTTDLAVVPIVVNAGAALLPAILAGITTFVALLFKPKELIRTCREKPFVPVLVVLLGLGIWGTIHLVSSGQGAPDTSRARSRGGATGGDSSNGIYVDWTRIALARIAASNGAVATKTIETLPVPAPQSDGPFVFRGGPQRRGILGQDLTGELELSWSFYPRWIDETGAEQEDTEAMILSSPAVWGNRVYGASCLLDPPDSFGVLFCVDATTGKQIWSLDKFEGQELKGFFSSPALTADGQYLLIGQGLHPDSQCRLICVKAQTGEVVWTHQVALHIESSPAIDGDMVVVGAGAIEDPATHKPISHPGFVVALRISDGTLLWQQDVVDPESSPIIAHGVAYIGSGFNGDAIVALHTDPEAGQNRIKWQTPAPYPITGAVTVHQDRVIVGGGNGDFVYRDPDPKGILLALDKETGKILWQTDMADAVLGAVAAGKVLICPVASGEVVALNPDNGDILWSASISGRAPVLAAPVVTESHVYAVSQDGYLAKLDLNSGAVLEKTYLNATDRPGAQGLSISSPLVAHGRLFVGSETGGLRCYVGRHTP
ncbi:MAG: PQQ-like beta-propeller repeat protein [Phycisphaerae bacterium]|nr:PQQ-like beta-propeller repeat protein [Phycisphaerae bacterium]